MPAWFEIVTDLVREAEVLRRRSYGVIEAVEGRFHRVVLRPCPKLVSLPEVLFWGRAYHRWWGADRCRLYFDQPRRFPAFLVVKYLISARGTTYATYRRVLEALDQIARIKRADALLCNLCNARISRRMMARWGWEPHCPSRWRRHFIKRFYGDYPLRPAWLRENGQLEKPGRFGSALAGPRSS